MKSLSNLAGRNAFREAFKNAGPKILEPIYDVEVIVPEEKMGDVMTDLQGRRAVIMGMDSEGNYQKILAKVPLAELNRYSTAFSSTHQRKSNLRDEICRIYPGSGRYPG